MNIFYFEFKQHLRSTIIWSVSYVAVLAMFMSAFPIYREQMDVLKPLLEGFPPAVLEAFGINMDLLFTVLGFYSFILLYIHLMSAMQGMMLGLAVMGKELRLKTADFLYTKPTTRSSVFFQKLGAIMSHLLISWSISSVFAILVLSQLSETTLDFKVLGYLLISNLLLMVLFAALGILTAMLLRKLKSVVGISISLVFGFFILSMMQGILDEAWVRFLSPFQYFENTYIFMEGHFEWALVAMYSVVVSLSILTAYVVLNKKDIHSV